MSLVTCQKWNSKLHQQQKNKQNTSVRVPHLSHASHDAEFLGGDEALQHDSDGHVDVILIDIVAEVHAGMSLCHSNNGFNVSDCDGDAACCLSVKKTCT